MNNNIFINNKDLISQLNQCAMTYAPSLELDGEINLLSNSYYSTIMSILHFGESELNYRKGERYNSLNLYPNLVSYYNNQMLQWNSRGISSIDIAIQTINEFITTGDLSDTPVSQSNFDDMKLRISEILVETHLKAADDCFAWKSASGESNYSGGNRKLKGKVWVHNLPFYANIGSESEHFKKKNNGGWKKEIANTITTQSGGTLYDRNCRTSGNISIGQTKNNKKQVSSSVTYWNQKTQSKQGQYVSYHYSKEGSSSTSFTLSL